MPDVNIIYACRRDLALMGRVMYSRRIVSGICALFAATFISPSADADFGFVPGNYYSSNYFDRTITQYSAGGSVVGSFTVPSQLGGEVRGLAFGGDNLLYATVSRGSSGFAVLALNSSGAVQASYLGPVYIAGNLSFGKIAIAGQNLYVCGQDQLTRFDLGSSSSGTVIYTNNQIFDVKPLPNGNLLVASAYRIDEITPAGALVRTIPLIGDGNSYTDIRGIEYDPITNSIYVTELGHTDFFFRLLRINAATGVLESNVTFTYGDDIFLDTSGNLLIGSRTESPRFFTRDLQQIGQLGGGQQMFVTQLIPEPGSVSLLALSGSAFVMWRRWRRGRRS